MKKAAITLFIQLMFGSLGAPELIINLIIIALLPGAGRIGKVAEELGKGIRNFHDGLGDKDENADKTKLTPFERRCQSP